MGNNASCSFFPVVHVQLEPTAIPTLVLLHSQSWIRSISKTSIHDFYFGQNIQRVERERWKKKKKIGRADLKRENIKKESRWHFLSRVTTSLKTGQKRNSSGLGTSFVGTNFSSSSSYIYLLYSNLSLFVDPPAFPFPYKFGKYSIYYVHNQSWPTHLEILDLNKKPYQKKINIAFTCSVWFCKFVENQLLCVQIQIFLNV